MIDGADDPPSHDGAASSASVPPGPPTPAPVAAPRRRLWLWLVGATLLVVLALLVYQVATWPDVRALATENPESTAFIERYRERQRDRGASDRVAWMWVPWAAISPELKRAVVAGEDLEFFAHGGFSTTEMRAALRATLKEGQPLRGASTITQQLAKNLWLTPSRNPWRKVKEALLTRQLERHLSKRRILEVYLNVVEFGPGVYGAEAAARRYFDKPAAALTRHEAALLAAGLPRPSSWHPGRETTGYLRYVAEIERRMARATFLGRYVGDGAPAGDSGPPAESLAAMMGAVDSLPGDTTKDSLRREPPDSTSERE